MPSVQPQRLAPQGGIRRHNRPARQAPPALSLVPETPVAPAADARRHRISMTTLDRASYQCGCGNVFMAPVSTDVACPACGGAQAW